jgi:hypothetical protein
MAFTVILIAVLHIPLAFESLPIIPFPLRPRGGSAVGATLRVGGARTTRGMTTTRATGNLWSQMLNTTGRND